MTREMHLKVSYLIILKAWNLKNSLFLNENVSDYFIFCVDMLFDEDTILLSFFQRYTDPDEEEDLKRDVIKYCGGGNFGGKVPMED